MLWWHDQLSMLKHFKSIAQQVGFQLLHSNSRSRDKFLVCGGSAQQAKIKRLPPWTEGRCCVLWQQFMLLLICSLLTRALNYNSESQLYWLVAVHCLIPANFHLSGVVITLHSKGRGSLDKHPRLPAENHYVHSYHHAKGQTYFYACMTHMHARTQILQIYNIV